MLDYLKNILTLFSGIILIMSCCFNAYAKDNNCQNDSASIVRGNTEFLQRHAIETKARMMFNGYQLADIEQTLSKSHKNYRG